MFTDYNDSILSELQQSIRKNCLESICSTIYLDWNNFEDQLSRMPHDTYEVVLASDVLYSQGMVQPLISVIEATLNPERGIALIGHQVRRAIVRNPTTRLPQLIDDQPLENFKERCSAAGLVWQQVPYRGGKNDDSMMILAVAKSKSALQLVDTENRVEIK